MPDAGPRPARARGYAEGFADSQGGIAKARIRAVMVLLR